MKKYITEKKIEFKNGEFTYCYKIKLEVEENLFKRIKRILSDMNLRYNKKLGGYTTTTRLELDKIQVGRI